MGVFKDLFVNGVSRFLGNVYTGGDVNVGGDLTVTGNIKKVSSYPYSPGLVNATQGISINTADILDKGIVELWTRFGIYVDYYIFKIETASSGYWGAGVYFEAFHMGRTSVIWYDKDKIVFSGIGDNNTPVISKALLDGNEIPTNMFHIVEHENLSSNNFSNNGGVIYIKLS